MKRNGKKQPGRENSKEERSSCCSARLRRGLGTCGLASASFLPREPQQMLSRKRNSKALHSWHFYTFLGALGVLGALCDYLCCFREIREIRGEVVFVDCGDRRVENIGT
jgi:hypothetical protein